MWAWLWPFWWANLDWPNLIVSFFSGVFGGALGSYFASYRATHRAEKEEYGEIEAHLKRVDDALEEMDRQLGLREDQSYR